MIYTYIDSNDIRHDYVSQLDSFDAKNPNKMDFVVFGYSEGRVNENDGRVFFKRTLGSIIKTFTRNWIQVSIICNGRGFLQIMGEDGQNSYNFEIRKLTDSGKNLFNDWCYDKAFVDLDEPDMMEKLLNDDNLSENIVVNE